MKSVTFRCDDSLLQDVRQFVNGSVWNAYPRRLSSIMRTSLVVGIAAFRRYGYYNLIGHAIECIEGRERVEVTLRFEKCK